MSGLKESLGGLGSGLKAAGGGMARTLGPVGEGLRKMTAAFGSMLAPLARRAVAIVIVLSVLVVSAGIAYFLLYQSDQDHSDELDARRDAAGTARDTVARMFTYQYETVDEELAQIEPLLTGSFKDEYSNLVRTQLAPIAKQQKARSDTDVVADAVISSDSDRVKLLLFLNQSSSSPNLEQPIQVGTSITVTMKKEDGDWLVAELEPL